MKYLILQFLHLFEVIILVIQPLSWSYLHILLDIFPLLKQLGEDHEFPEWRVGVDSRFDGFPLLIEEVLIEDFVERRGDQPGTDGEYRFGVVRRTVDSVIDFCCSHVLEALHLSNIVVGDEGSWHTPNP